MLAGLGGGMPGNLLGGMTPQLGPSAKDMEEARQQVLFKKTVLLKGIHVRTFDLSKNDQAEAYEILITGLLNSMKEKRSYIMSCERQFVAQPEPRWMVHIQWADFDLKVEPNPTVGSDDEEKSSTEH